MIEINDVKKQFDKIDAVSGVSLEIQDKNVFGLLGTNGAGKSTLLRMMAGILKPDQGSIKVNGEEVFDNPRAKCQSFYISDDQYYYPNADIDDMKRFYATYYPDFDNEKFEDYLEHFKLPKDRKISTFSKGMKKQLAILFAVCSKARYLLLDETFDGLDPVVRQGIKSLFAYEMEERDLTPIIASHNLRELEDICDHVGLLHEGGILLSKDLEEMKSNLHRIQLVLPDSCQTDINLVFQIVQYHKSGKLFTLTVRGEEESVLEQIHHLNPVYYELLPLSLEEIFIGETEVVGYDAKNLIF